MQIRQWYHVTSYSNPDKPVGYGFACDETGTCLTANDIISWAVGKKMMLLKSFLKENLRSYHR